jgi:hypothetical protein
MQRRNFTLPDLEERLDALAEGALHQITRHDYERLFGVNNAALGRLRNLMRFLRAVNEASRRTRGN